MKLITDDGVFDYNGEEFIPIPEDEAKKIREECKEAFKFCGTCHGKFENTIEECVGCEAYEDRLRLYNECSKLNLKIIKIIILILFIIVIGLIVYLR